jgi:hypothetical protein
MQIPQPANLRAEGRLLESHPQCVHVLNTLSSNPTGTWSTSIRKLTLHRFSQLNWQNICAPSIWDAFNVYFLILPTYTVQRCLLKGHFYVVGISEQRCVCPSRPGSLSYPVSLFSLPICVVHLLSIILYIVSSITCAGLDNSMRNLSYHLGSNSAEAHFFSTYHWRIGVRVRKSKIGKREKKQIPKCSGMAKYMHEHKLIMWHIEWKWI